MTYRSQHMRLVQRATAAGCYCCCCLLLNCSLILTGHRVGMVLFSVVSFSFAFINVHLPSVYPCTLWVLLLVSSGWPIELHSRFFFQQSFQTDAGTFVAIPLRIQDTHTHTHSSMLPSTGFIFNSIWRRALLYLVCMYHIDWQALFLSLHALHSTHSVHTTECSCVSLLLLLLSTGSYFFFKCLEIERVLSHTHISAPRNSAASYSSMSYWIMQCCVYLMFFIVAVVWIVAHCTFLSLLLLLLLIFNECNFRFMSDIYLIFHFEFKHSLHLIEWM